MRHTLLSPLALQQLVELLQQGLGEDAQGLAALCETDLTFYEPVAAQLETLVGQIRTALGYSPEQRRELRRRLIQASE